MYSDVVKAALEREVVGQTRAVHTVVRGLTRLVGGITPRERPLCAYMFMGPPGTGKSHLVRTLTRLLHGDEQRAVVINCAELIQGDPRLLLMSQLAPLFAPAAARPGSPPGARDGTSQGAVDAPPLSIVQIDFLEEAPQVLCQVLASVLQSGQLMLPDGTRGRLRDCAIFFSSRLCSSEILDVSPRIGFSGSIDEDDGDYEDRLTALCYERAEEHFGSDFVGRLDRFVVFHRMQKEHLPVLLDLRVQRLNQWLAGRGIGCELTPDAREFLLVRGRIDLQRGARSLQRAHQQFVEFPVADLLVSGKVPVGRSIHVDRRAGEEHLHFTVSRAEEHAAVEIPVG